MIASVFSKSRPFNYILITSLLVFCYFIYQIKHVISTEDSSLTLFDVIQKGTVLLLVTASLFITNFITKRNGLSKDNSYSFLFYFAFLLFIPSVFNKINLILASFFILLALRRLISMKSLITPKEKIFDASLWIFIATLFHFWSILFIVIVFASIIFHVSSDYRNWILPFIAFFTVGVLFLFFSLLIDKEWISIVWKQIDLNFDFHYFSNSVENLALTLFIIFSVFFLFAMLLTLSRRPLILHASYKKIIFSLLISLLIYVFSPVKSNDLLIFSILPLSILVTAYLEFIRDSMLKEIITSSIVITGLLMFMFQL